ncbi:MAG: hypothetical protein JWP01_2306 [Myxococcales bacterium]|nr:hypothetical protein [Myxococcales bacterium]
MLWPDAQLIVSRRCSILFHLLVPDRRWLTYCEVECVGELLKVRLCKRRDPWATERISGVTTTSSTGRETPENKVLIVSRDVDNDCDPIAVM